MISAFVKKNAREVGLPERRAARGLESECADSSKEVCPCLRSCFVKFEFSEARGREVIDLPGLGLDSNEQILVRSAPF